MPERQELEALFLANLAWIDRVVAAIARRHGLGPEDREDVASWVKLRLVEDDYAVLAKFRGACAVTTYLTTVITMLFRDYRAQKWGRWRPSAAAQRGGPLAVRLETLTHRDGLALEHAGELLRTSGETTLTDRQLAALLGELPRREPLRPVEVGPEPLDDAVAGDGADAPLLRDEDGARRGAATRALERAMGRLPAEDRVILQMHYWHGTSVAAIARALGLEQAPLYPRLQRLHRELRRALEADGVSRDAARELLGDESAA